MPRLDLRSRSLREVQLTIAKHDSNTASVTEAKYSILDVSQNPDLGKLEVGTESVEYPIDTEHLEIFFASDTGFLSFPEWLLTKFPKMKMIAFKTSLIKEISMEVFDCENRLSWLILTNNDLKSLPPSIGKLKHLRKFAISGNLLTSLPSEMANCREMELMRLSDNLLMEVPDWLWKLPKLAWLAIMGNPAFPCRLLQDSSQEKENSSSSIGAVLKTLPVFKRDHGNTNYVGELGTSKFALQVNEKELLGAGGSGKVLKGRMTFESTEKNVAVKYFDVSSLIGNAARGRPLVASDGAVENEIEILARLGNIFSDNSKLGNIVYGKYKFQTCGTVRVLGLVQDEEGVYSGAVLDLLDGYEKLGERPNFDTVTRDWFSKDCVLGDYPLAEQIRTENLHTQVLNSNLASDLTQIGIQVTGTMKRLAEFGIYHGDMYAHNIIARRFQDQTIDTVLADYGAATYIPEGDMQRQYYEKLEVRALGYLLDDLLTAYFVDVTETEGLSDHEAKSLCQLRELSSIRDACLDQNVNTRPSFQVVMSRFS